MKRASVVRNLRRQARQLYVLALVVFLVVLFLPEQHTVLRVLEYVGYFAVGLCICQSAQKFGEARGVQRGAARERELFKLGFRLAKQETDDMQVARVDADGEVLFLREDL